MNAIENQREDYYRAAGVAPGLPTMKGSYADPEVEKEVLLHIINQWEVWGISMVIQ